LRCATCRVSWRKDPTFAIFIALSIWSYTSLSFCKAVVTSLCISLSIPYFFLVSVE